MPPNLNIHNRYCHICHHTNIKIPLQFFASIKNNLPHKVGDPVKISLNMELYPLPENKNLVWVIEDSQQIEEKIELQPGTFFLPLHIGI